MKKCKSCQKEIDDKAKKCPHCQTDQRIWFAKHKVLTVIFAVIIIAIIGGTSGGDKSTSNSNTNETKATPTPILINVTRMADDFDENQLAAEAEWNGKLVEFSAIISNITDSGLSFYNVASKDFSSVQISCRTANKEQLLSLKNGESVTVRGVIGKQTIGVISMNDCKVVK